MSPDFYRACRHPKGPKRKTVKGQKQRSEDAVKKRVRARCVERDGQCRIGEWELNPDDTHDDELIGDGCEANGCEGESQWAHMHAKRRSQTRGQAPDVRHTTAESLMLCSRHHRQYDGTEKPRLTIQALTAKGADGPLQFSVEPT